MPFTIDQLRAIESRDENLLLSAAAGSGKTTVLVERVLRLIRDDGCDIGRMLIVTFTRASAADMRKSLIAALEKEAVLRPDLPHLREQAEKATTAGISTIHAFCGDLLREHFHAANVDPNYRILETAEADFLLEKALYDGMNACYAAMDDDLHALTEDRKSVV